MITGAIHLHLFCIQLAGARKMESHCLLRMVCICLVSSVLLFFNLLVYVVSDLKLLINFFVAVLCNKLDTFCCTH